MITNKLLSKIFLNDFMRIRGELLDVIEISVDSLGKIEEIFTRTKNEDVKYIARSFNSDESKFEKVLFTLSVIRSVYKKHNLDKEFYSLVYSAYAKFATNNVRTICEQNGKNSKTEFLNNRLNFYLREIDLLKKLENPHSGFITNYWYIKPLSEDEVVDKNVITLSFFLTTIPDYILLVLNGTNEVFNKYLNKRT